MRCHINEAKKFKPIKILIRLSGLWFALRLLLPIPVALAEGENDPLWNRPSYEKKVYLIGQRILQANGFKERVAFIVISDDDPNASASRREHNLVRINRGLLKYVDSDDELASVLSHEIAHLTMRHSSILRPANSAPKLGAIFLGTALALAGADPNLAADAAVGMGRKVAGPMHRPLETEADVVGLNYMVRAGYNPLAAETMMTKISGDASAISRFWSSHPVGTDRLNHLRKEIETHYPEFLTPQTANNLPGAPYQIQAHPKGEVPSRSPNLVYTQPATITPSQVIVSETNPTNGQTADNPVRPAPAPVSTKAPDSAFRKPPETVAYAFTQQSEQHPQNVNSQDLRLMSVAQKILLLDATELRLVKLLSQMPKGYLETHELREHFETESSESLQVILTKLEKLELIRLVGDLARPMILLSDEASKELGKKAAH